LRVPLRQWRNAASLQQRDRGAPDLSAHGLWDRAAVGAARAKANGSTDRDDELLAAAGNESVHAPV
jgi:hypothetical protein